MSQYQRICPISFVLCVDDDKASTDYLDVILPTNAHLKIIKNLPELESFERSEVDLLIVDPDFCGLRDRNIVQILKQMWPRATLLALSNSVDIDSIVLTLKSGAHHFLPKPIVRRDLKYWMEVSHLSHDADAKVFIPDFEGLSPSLDFLPNVAEFRKDIALVLRNSAENRQPILAIGEQGTGRRNLAEAIHEIDTRYARKELVYLDLDARDFRDRPMELLARIDECFELDFDGQTEVVDSIEDLRMGGTVYISDIEQFPPDFLVHLHQRITAARDHQQNQKYRVRFMASITSLNIVEKGSTLWRFLAQNFSANRLLHPPLRNHRDDIPRLARYYLDSSQLEGGSSRSFGPCAIDKLMSHDWPGNLLELRDTVRRAALFTEKNVIKAIDIYIE